MRIGVDARILFEKLTGIGRYTFELSKALVQVSNAKLFFYTPNIPAVEILRGIGPGNFRSSSCGGRLSRMLWSQTKLPYLSNKDSIDLFWGATHRLPQFLPKSIARVVTIHDLVWRYAPQTMRPLSLFVEKKMMPHAIELADLVMADSHGTATGIAEIFPEFAHKVRVVHLGVSKFSSPEDSSVLLQLKISLPYILFVGTLEPRKNLERLLNAFSMLPHSIKGGVQLVIVGGKGWGEVDIPKLLQKFALQDSVLVLGYVGDQKLATLYANARFLVMPSLYEGFGLPLVEAMQYGKPVLTSRDGALSEVAGDAGVFIDPYSVESISLGLQRMLTDDELIKNLGKNASRRALDFSWDKCAAATMAVFKEAMILRDIRLAKSK